MDTAGGATVTLTGTHLPPYACSSLAACGNDAHAFALAAAAARVTFKYVGRGVASSGGAVDSSATFVCTNLKVAVAGTQVTCAVPTGVGSALWWSVEVGAAGVAAVAQASGLAQFEATRYAAPQIAALAPNYAVDYAALGLRGIFDLNTAGGDYVLITGRHLGPNFAKLYASTTAQDAAPALVVTYGPVSGGPWGYNTEAGNGGVFKYTAADCYVLTSSTEVLCTTAPGVGANLTWRVVVGGQAGSSLCADPDGDGAPNGCAYNLSTSYAPPTVKPIGALDESSSSARAVTGAGVSGATTTGGQQLVISGAQFGPSDGEEAPVVTYGPPGEEDRYLATSCAVSSS
jgi:hypothetical protein